MGGGGGGSGNTLNPGNPTATARTGGAGGSGKIIVLEPEVFVAPGIWNISEVYEKVKASGWSN